MSYSRFTLLPREDELGWFVEAEENEGGTDPHTDIVAYNSKVPVEIEKINYTAIYTCGTSATEIHGLRPKQEDRILANSLPDTSPLDKKTWASILVNTVAVLQEKCTEIETRTGSCFLANIITADTIYTTNVGDSTAFVVTLNGPGKIRVALLNKHLHSAKSAKEQKRVERNHGFVSRDRVGGVLAVSRNLGPDFVKGVTHDSDFYAYAIPAEGRSFLITACDGLTETNIDLSNIGYIVAARWEHYQKKLPIPSDEYIARRMSFDLAFAALNAGSQDNISVMVTPLFGDDRPSLSYTAVFDGHGGDEVSEILYQNFDKVLKHQLSLHLSHEQQAYQSRQNLKNHLQQIITVIEITANPSEKEARLARQFLHALLTHPSYRFCKAAIKTFNAELDEELTLHRALSLLQTYVKEAYNKAGSLSEMDASVKAAYHLLCTDSSLCYDPDQNASWSWFELIDHHIRASENRLLAKADSKAKELFMRIHIALDNVITTNISEKESLRQEINRIMFSKGAFNELDDKFKQLQTAVDKTIQKIEYSWGGVTFFGMGESRFGNALRNVKISWNNESHNVVNKIRKSMK